jgi:hypothetical protein
LGTARYPATRDTNAGRPSRSRVDDMLVAWPA